MEHDAVGGRAHPTLGAATSEPRPHPLLPDFSCPSSSIGLLSPIIPP